MFALAASYLTFYEADALFCSVHTCSYEMHIPCVVAAMPAAPFGSIQLLWHFLEIAVILVPGPSWLRVISGGLGSVKIYIIQYVLHLDLLVKLLQCN